MHIPSCPPITITQMSLPSTRNILQILVSSPGSWIQSFSPMLQSIALSCFLSWLHSIWSIPSKQAYTHPEKVHARYLKHQQLLANNTFSPSSWNPWMCTISCHSFLPRMTAKDPKQSGSKQLTTQTLPLLLYWKASYWETSQAATGPYPPWLFRTPWLCLLQESLVYHHQSWNWRHITVVVCLLSVLLHHCCLSSTGFL